MILSCQLFFFRKMLLDRSGAERAYESSEDDEVVALLDAMTIAPPQQLERFFILPICATRTD